MIRPKHASWLTGPRRAGVALLLGAALGTPALARAEGPGDLVRQSYQLEAKGDLAGALSAVKRLKGEGDLAYFVALRTGWLNYLAGKWSDAEAGYRSAIAAAPKAVEPQLGLTLALMGAKRWREVEKTARVILKRDSGNATARLRLAQALYSQGNYDEAATVYGRLTEDYPADITYRNGLGWSLYQQGNKAGARRTFDGVLSLAPDDVSAKQGKAAP